ncbi:MAG: hypothetical protein SGI90_01850 [Candidatus Eisenbacteria bacterium]|mgnify:CR=1 FL=1|nr:hypothetical protein [Candidatus Eisenbacteria bacterium]
MRSIFLGSLLGFGLLLSPTSARAQSLNLRDLLPDFLRRGVSLAPPAVGTDHSAHFNSGVDQFDAVDQINSEIAYQLSAFPLSSSAGGFAYEYDANLGVFNRPTRSFGPVYTERAFNVGQGKINFGVNYSRFTFDEIDEIDLRGDGLQFVFQHLDSNNDGNNTQFFFEGDVVAADVFVNIESSVTALVTTFGVTDRFDVGLVVPAVDVSMDVRVDSHVERLATGGTAPDTHAFPNGTGVQTTQTGASANGVGDIQIRAKYRLTDGRALAALLGEVRLPTGDEDNLLGVGALGGRVTFVGTLNSDVLAPHVNLGYQANGKGLPDELTYRLGADLVLDPKITLSGEILGLTQSDVRSVAVEEVTLSANTSPTGPPNIVEGTFERTTYTPGESRSTLDAAIGIKINLARTLLISLNGVFPLTSDGLTDEFTPLIGFDYSF